MRICVDGLPTENGHRNRGIGTVTRELLAALDRLAVAPTTSICYMTRRPLPSVAHLRWVQRSASAEWTGVNERIHPLLAALWKTVDTGVVLPNELSGAGCDVFLATDPGAVARSTECRTVAIVYDMIPLLFPDDHVRPVKHAPRRAIMALQRQQLMQADRLVAISEATKRDVINFLGIAPDRIDVAHLAVDTAVFQPQGGEGERLIHSQFGLDGRYFLYVGEMDSRKNVGALIQAFARVAQRQGSVKLVLAGLGSRSRDLLQATLPRDLIANGRIVMFGHVSSAELAALYSSAVALVFPSRYEGFGLPVLEAMSCGTTVITSPVSAMPEVAGDAAIYAEPTDVTAIASAMASVLGDPSVRSTMARRGLDRAREFSWQRTALAVVSSCERAMATPRAT